MRQGGSPEDPHAVRDLLRQAAAGELRAWRTLMAPVAPWVRRWIAAHRVPGWEADDWWQEAAVAVWLAGLQYDATRGAWAAWAPYVVRRRLQSALKGALRAKHRALNTALPLEPGLVAGDGPTGSDPANRLVAEERWHALAEWAATALTPWERRCWAHWLGGGSIAHLAHRWRTRPKRVDNAIQRAQRKLRAAWDPATDRFAASPRRRMRRNG